MQTLRFPSAVILILLQVLQKFSVIDVMKPICPQKPLTLYAFEVSLNFGSICLRSGYFSLMIVTNSLKDINFSDFHLFPSKGMYSMNLTSSGLWRVSSTKSKISLSLNPLMTTQFNLIESKFAFNALSIDLKTWFQPFLRVINSNFCGIKVSKLMLIAFNP